MTRLMGAALLGACLLSAQQQPPQAAEEPLIRVGAQEVLLDIVVRDRRGRIVRDLKPEEVEVYDQGARRDLRAFRLIAGGTVVSGETVRSGAASPTATPPPALYDPQREPRLVSLVFEGLDTESRRLMRKACEQLLAGELGSNVYLAVFMIDPQLRVLQPYTADRNKAREAVELATGAPYTEYMAAAEQIRSQLESAEGYQGALETAVALSTPGRGSSGAGAGGAMAEAAMNQMTLNMLRVEESLTRAQQGRSSLFALLSLVEAQMAYQGRKTVLFFSRGLIFPEHLKHHFDSVIGRANRAGVSVYAVDARGLTLDASNSAGSSLLDSAVKSSRRQQTVDGGQITPDQVRVFDTAGDSIHANPQRNLEDLATATGGFLIANTNDFKAPFEQIREDIGTYYEVAYVPDITEYDGSFHKIEVKVSRPGVKIQARSGYFALPPGESSALDYEAPLLDALSASPLPNDFSYRAAALRFGKSGERVQYALVVEVPLEGFSFVPEEQGERRRARISMLALLKDLQGEVIERFSRDLGVYADASEVDSFQKRNFVQTYSLTLAPGRYRLETAVMDAEGKRVSAKRAFVVAVPPPAGVALSSLSLVRRTEPWAAEVPPGAPFNFEGKRVVPTLDGVVQAQPGGGLSFYFVVYPGEGVAEPPRAALEFFRDGHSAGKAALDLPQPGPSGTIPFVVSLPMDNFEPGQYELRLVAVQGETGVEEMTSFSVQR